MPLLLLLLLFVLVALVLDVDPELLPPLLLAALQGMRKTIPWDSKSRLHLCNKHVTIGQQILEENKTLKQIIAKEKRFVLSFDSSTPAYLGSYPVSEEPGKSVNLNSESCFEVLTINDSLCSVPFTTKVILTIATPLSFSISVSYFCFSIGFEF